MTDPFLLGLITGGALSLAGLGATLVRLAALGVVGLAAWTLAHSGLAGLEAALNDVLTGMAGGELQLAAGTLVGIALGAAFARLLADRRP